MPHTRYRSSMPNNDGGACAGAWASTSLPRLCASVSHRKEKAAEPPGRRAKVSTLAAHPAIGWTSPLPAVRMRAAMLVSAVVATCRGRLRRGAIREDVLADEPHGWIWPQQLRRRSTRLSQSGTCCFPMHAHTNIIATMRFFVLVAARVFAACGSYWSEAATARERTVTRACDSKRGVAGSRACSEIKGSPTRAAAMMHR